MNNTSMPVRRLNCTIPTEVFKMLKELAVREDRTMSNILKRLIIQEYKKGNNKK